MFAAIDIVNIVEDKVDHSEGLAIELLNRMSHQLNFTYDVNFYPLIRAVDLVRRGRADAFIGIYYSKTRAEFMDYSEIALFQDEMKLFSAVNANFNWQGDIEQLKNKRIALVRGGAYGAMLNKIRQEMHIIEVNSVNQQFNLLAKGRVDLIAYNGRTAPLILAKLKMTDKITSHLPALNIRRGYFAFSKHSKNREILKKFDQYMLELAKTGKLKALQQRFNQQ